MIREAEMEELERKWREQNAQIMAAHPDGGDDFDADGASSASASAEASLPADAQTLDGVLEQDLPQTLTVTIQDLEVIFTKDLSYQETGKLETGQEITVTYTGSLDSHPTALKAAAK